MLSFENVPYFKLEGVAVSLFYANVFEVFSECLFQFLHGITGGGRITIPNRISLINYSPFRKRCISGETAPCPPVLGKDMNCDWPDDRGAYANSRR